LQYAFRRAGRAPKILHPEHLRQSHASGTALPPSPLTASTSSCGQVARQYQITELSMTSNWISRAA
jgi:hypothetical protein